MAIVVNTYKSIADLINNSQARGEDISLEMLQMRNDLDNSEVDDEDINKEWLYKEINRTYVDIEINHKVYSREIINFVSKLQNFITDNYNSVNDFIRNYEITVLPVFADISNLVGYPIDNDLVVSEIELCGS